MSLSVANLKSTFDWAKAYVEADFSILPVLLDGSKAPAEKVLPQFWNEKKQKETGKWEPFQSRKPTPEELKLWFDRKDPYGIGVIGGNISGGAQCIDFDDLGTAESFLKIITEDKPELAKILTRVRSPNGLHLWFRCEEIEGGKKLAGPNKEECKAKGIEWKATIETRAEENYAIAPGSPINVNETRRPYQFIEGFPNLFQIPTIPPSDRNYLLQTASIFDRRTIRHKTTPPKNTPHLNSYDRLTPWADFDLRGPSFEELLQGSGATFIWGGGDDGYVRRPGKKNGSGSASIGYCQGKVGEPLMHFFTSNWPEFEQGESVGKFNYILRTKFNNNWAKAAEYCEGLGFGDKANKKSHPPQKATPIQTQSNTSTETPGVSPSNLVIRRASEITERDVDWIWFPYVARGEVHLLDGNTGEGKSSVARDIAARISTGSLMPPDIGARNGSAKPETILILSAEENAETTIRPRLRHAGADLTKILIVDGIQQGDDFRPPAFPMDSDLVERAIIENGVTVAIIDPILAYCDDSIDSHKDQSVRRLMSRLQKIAEKTNCCIILIRHLNKSGGNVALHRGMGSAAILAAARIGLIIGKDPNDESRCILAWNKGNIGPRGKSLAFRLIPSGKVSVVQWEGESNLSANDLVRTVNKEESELDKCTKLIRQLLKGGRMEISEFNAAIAEFSEATIRRARGKAGIENEKEGFGKEQVNYVRLKTENVFDDQ